MKKLFLSITFLLSGSYVLAQNLVINEVMQSNIDYLMVDNDYPDSWVELFNPTNQDIDLRNYLIGTNADVSTAYRIPVSTIIKPHNHVVIYCDKANSGLHTDFRIDSGKGSLILFSPEGQQLDRLDLAKMPAPNIAYGRRTDGADEWQYELQPTAGKPNDGGGATALLPEPIFNIKGGVFTNPVYLTINIPAGLPDDVKIYLTLDGSEPTLESQSGKQAAVQLYKNTIVRAKLMSASGAALSPRSTTHSFIFHPRQVTMPVVSLVGNNDDFYSMSTGILTPFVQDNVPNYMQSWRRPVNVEFFEEYGAQLLNQLGETAVSGVSTRGMAQKSLKLYANNRFGTKSYAHNFWHDKPNVTSVKSMILRNGGNNCFSSRINDAMVQRLFGTHVPFLDWQAYEPVIVYLNGDYHGVYGLRERSDEDYVSANYDGLEDIEIVNEQSYISAEARKGTLFDELYKMYKRNGVDYEQFEQVIDIDNFAATVAAEIYAMNTDFPTNNVSLWRPTAAGGRWRWILKDLDRAGMTLPLYPYDFDMVSYLFGPSGTMFKDDSFALYQRMISFLEFRNRVIDMLAVYLGDFLRPELVCQMIDDMDKEIRDEAYATFRTYNYGDDFAMYHYGIRDLRDFANERPSLLYAQLSRYFSLGAVVPLSINCNMSDVLVDDIPLTSGDFKGSYFINHPLRLTNNDSEYGWQLKISNTDGTTVTHNLEQADVTLLLSDYIQDPSQVSQVSFSAVTCQPSSVVQQTSHPEPTYYDLRGIRIKSPYRGITIKKNNDGRVQKITASH